MTSCITDLNKKENMEPMEPIINKMLNTDNQAGKPDRKKRWPSIGTWLMLCLLGLMISVVNSACQKDDYFDNTGVLDPNYNGSSLDYLKEKGYQFDSLVKIIHLAGLDNVLENEQVTFFAPGDSSIKLAVETLNANLRIFGKDTVSDLSQIAPEVWRKELAMYIFEGENKVVDYPQLDLDALPSFHGQAYTCYDSVRIMNIGAVYDDAAGVKYAGYRHLVLSYIPSYSAPLVNWINAPVASSDIITTNGVIHALRYTSHIFGFDVFKFVTDAQNSVSPRE